MSAKNLRILIYYCSASPGARRVLAQLAPAMARRPDVEMVRVLQPANSTTFPDIATLNTPKLEIRSLYSGLVRGHSVAAIVGASLLRPFARRLFFRGQSVELKRHAADCDVVYNAWPHENAFPQLGKPVVCTYHDVTNLEFPEILGGRRAVDEWESSLEWITKSAAVVVISESMKESLLRHFGAVARRVAAIDHTIFPESWRSGGLKRSGISATLPERYFVWPANTNTHKNHYSLLVAWSRFPRRAEFPLVLFGDGTDSIAGFSSRSWPANPDHARLAGLVERLGLRHGTDFYALGYVPNGDVAPIIANAYALIAPTLAEGGGGLTVEEALDLGVPVLCSDIPVTREWAAKRTADIVWFDPYSTDSILSAVNELIEGYDTYKRSAVEAMNDPRPSWDDVARRYVEVFRQALEANQNGVAD